MTSKTLFLIAVVITFLIATVGGIVGYYVGLEEAFSAGLTAALVYVTACYVYLHSKNVEVANRQAEIMKNAQFNAVAPVIALGVKGTKIIWIDWRNIGTGPALNFRCWIEDVEHPQLRNVKKAVCLRAIAAGDGPRNKNIDTEIEGYTLHTGMGYRYLRAQYESVFGKTYESRLISWTNAAPELKYGEVTNDNDIVVL